MAGPAHDADLRIYATMAVEGRTRRHPAAADAEPTPTPAIGCRNPGLPQVSIVRFSLLAAGIDPLSLATSQSRISVTVAEVDCARAVAVLHEEFLSGPAPHETERPATVAAGPRT